MVPWCSLGTVRAVDCIHCVQHSITNPVHKSSHTLRAPPYVQWMQDRHMLLSFHHHKRHHSGDHTQSIHKFSRFQSTHSCKNACRK
mmetsp:Transcript_2074/g.7488  ORF Transcript_2074/g.7488 Transcript_2074/m.7488 type:complete len:86 (-) Transcript_2074:1550-1807(-)